VRFQHLGASRSNIERPAALWKDPKPPAEVLAKLHAADRTRRICLMNQGLLTSRGCEKTTDFEGDYDQLARFGKMGLHDRPAPEDLTMTAPFLTYATRRPERRGAA